MSGLIGSAVRPLCCNCIPEIGLGPRRMHALCVLLGGVMDELSLLLSALSLALVHALYG